MVYAIYEGFFPDVEKKLNRVAKKCVKHGNDFTFEIKGEEIREHKDKETDVIRHYKFVLVEVEGTAKVDNWECIAVMENHDAGNIIKRINTTIDIPERFKHTENICEHCNSKRYRTNLYVIHNTETDEWKQVGGNCLALYTGGLNMEYVTAYLDGITELEENDGVVNYGENHYIPVKEALHYAIAVINKTGYFNSESALPTKNLVSILLSYRLDMAVEKINNELRQSKLEAYFSQKDFLFDEETKDVVEKIVEYYKNVDDDSEFVHNVKVMLSEGYIRPRNIGYICYLPCGYAKHIQREIERAKKIETEKSEYFGEIGKRYKDKEIFSFERITAWETMYGITYVFKIVLTDGSILTWKTSNYPYLNDRESFDKVTFTVKDHKEYRGQKQTEITRCKITAKQNKN